MPDRIPAANQETFDFNRAAQLRILEQAVINARGPSKTILKALDSYQREHPNSFPSVRVIAHNCGLSTKTIRRGLHEMADPQVGLLTITPRLRPDGSYTSHSYAINWLRLLESVPPSDGGGTPTVGGGTPMVGVGYSHGGSSLHKRPSKRPVKRTPYAPTDGVSKCWVDDEGSERKRFWGREKPLTREELTNGPIVAELYRFAQERGWIGGGELDRLRFFALCRYCGHKGREPGKYLTTLLKAQAFDQIRQEDEEAARRYLASEMRAGVSQIVAGVKFRSVEGS